MGYEAVGLPHKLLYIRPVNCIDAVQTLGIGATVYGL